MVGCRVIKFEKFQSKELNAHLMPQIRKLNKIDIAFSLATTGKFRERINYLMILLSMNPWAEKIKIIRDQNISKGKTINPAKLNENQFVMVFGGFATPINYDVYSMFANAHMRMLTIAVCNFNFPLPNTMANAITTKFGVNPIETISKTTARFNKIQNDERLDQLKEQGVNRTTAIEYVFNNKTILDGEYELIMSCSWRSTLAEINEKRRVLEGEKEDEYPTDLETDDEE
ncbi:unnamed protein product [Caenorhabditis angaria]|uniref:Uncharacterized protein n=1 Tax=Caenorhabditis angaria TaxID=860376 RepID=A0A9P1N1W4_9PELO|nr:unnamed protein product [Caenorhabditis angaria]